MFDDAHQKYGGEINTSAYELVAVILPFRTWPQQVQIFPPYAELRGSASSLLTFLPAALLVMASLSFRLMQYYGPCQAKLSLHRLLSDWVE